MTKAAEATIQALDKRIDFLHGSAEAANEIYAERGMSAVCAGYTPENFDFFNAAPGLLARAKKLKSKRDQISGIKATSYKTEEEEDLPF